MDRKGLLYGLLCYCIWGLFPLYWRLLESVDSFEILAHRMLWSGVFMVTLFCGIRKVRLKDHIKHPPAITSTRWSMCCWAICSCTSG